MKQLHELSTAPDPPDSSARTLGLPVDTAPGRVPPAVPSSGSAAVKTAPLQMVLIVLGTFGGFMAVLLWIYHGVNTP